MIGPPMLTLVINGTEYQTFAPDGRGKIGDCDLVFVWDGVLSLRVEINSRGYNRWWNRLARRWHLWRHPIGDGKDLIVRA